MRLITPAVLALSAAMALPASAAPEAREPTIRAGTSITGKPLQIRTWEFRAGEVALRDLTIAETDYLWRDYPADQLEPIRGTLLCPVESGQIQARQCVGSCSDEAVDPCGAVIGGLNRLEAVRFPELPEHAPSDRFRDFVSIEFELDPRSRPEIDLGQGEMRANDQIVASTSRIALRDIYPARALRQGIEGRMTLTCQVQTDISVICRQSAFDPADHARLFESVAAQLGLLLDVKRELPDGSSTAGSRFQWAVAFRLS